MAGSYERVFTVTQYDEGPRAGVAEYDGMPHVYLSVWNEARDDFENWMVLTPIGREALRLALEDWQIWLRWETAFHDGLVALETRPALPQDHRRRTQLQPLLAEQLIPDRTRWFAARGTFRPVGAVDAARRGLPPMEVTWTPVNVEIVEDRLVTLKAAVLDG